MTDLVRALDDGSAVDPAAVGGKAAALARLRARGVPVPDGFVVTTAAYRRLVDDPEIRDLIAALADTAERAPDAEREGQGVERDANGEHDADADAADAADADDAAADRRRIAAAIRTAIRERPLPDGVAEGVAEHLPDGPVAVRSSATSEDRPAASFAGQYDTFLDVRGTEAVLDRIAACMASAFTDRAVAYRPGDGADPDRVEVAVLVQTFVEPDVSGIAFSADPVSGDRSVTVIEAGPGRGTEQVSGRTTADTVRFDRERDRIAEYRVGGDRRGRSLSTGDVRSLAAVVGRIAEEFGAPQDVEWALVDGELSVLQSRPITALFPVPEPTPTDGRTHLYYSFGHRQGMPEAMPPLVLDSWERLVEWLSRGLGLDDPLAATAGGHLFVDMTPFLGRPLLRGRVLSSLEVIDERSVATMRRLLGTRAAEFRAARLPFAAAGRVARAAGRWLPAVARVAATVPRALLVDTPEETAAALEREYDRELSASVRRIRRRETVGRRLDAGFEEIMASPRWLIGPFYGPFLAAVVAGAALRRLVPGHDDEVADLALGIEDDVVFRMTTALGDLADSAREEPGLAAALREGATLAEIRSRDDADAFLDALDGFLDEYGHRAVGEIDWSRPRYREDPSPLLATIGGTLRSRTEGDHRRLAEALSSRATAARETLIDEANPLVRPAVRRLTRVYRGGLATREHPKFAVARLLDELRTEALAAGADLADSGAIPGESAVWLLTLEELRTGLVDRRSLAGIDFAARRRAFERARSRRAPALVTSDGEIPRAPRSTTGEGDRLVGTGAAPGVVEGRVRVVTDPGETGLEAGEVLVAPYTDPGWTPLFATAAAVVTEVGGRLTHGSLVAREYGIPSVVAVEDATSLLRTGERVRVDGAAGTVDLLDRALAPEPAERTDEPPAGAPDAGGRSRAAFDDADADPPDPGDHTD
ncbi:PEP/pyruvate-binding domain-containing protein [Halobaculum lipolyticum]|uniref:PEP/pyruvate-binding domain-containing protein n=1 Tax=Halobaculum lipolyticum TaxID=3032001 RepID=A0ABD5W6P9_9EURY|nr:PEP/pyruvate-binding domain-containing protein [Halobaculum sp. DT31]